MSLPKEPSKKAIHAAAVELYAHGHNHRWWPESLPKDYRDMDSIGESEFKDIAWHILKAAYKAENSN